jgi:hypothetical protein
MISGDTSDPENDGAQAPAQSSAKAGFGKPQQAAPAAKPAMRSSVCARAVSNMTGICCVRASRRSPLSTSENGKWHNYPFTTQLLPIAAKNLP